MEFLDVRIVDYSVCNIAENRKQNEEGKNGPEQQSAVLSSRRSDHPCAKNSEISSAGIAPSRRIVQRFSSSVRSIMVDAVSRGEVPPSTMIGTRTPSCSLTAAAVVHSDSPLRFAEVAVMGIAAALTTSSGIFAL